MITFANSEKLKELGVLGEFENNELTILRLSYFLNIPFIKVEKNFIVKDSLRLLQTIHLLILNGYLLY